MICHPRRWQWLISRNGTILESIQSRPEPGAHPSVVGHIAGLDVITSLAVPTDLNGTQDPLIVLRAADDYVGETPSAAGVIRDFTGSNTLTAAFQALEFLAVSFELYANSAVVITGTGLTTPTW